MSTFRYANKRIGGRASNGQFKRLTFQDVTGVAFNERPQVCNACGYQWTPVVVSGKCLDCGSTDTQAAPPPPEIQAKIDRYREIGQAHPYGIDPRDKDLMREMQDLYHVTRRWR